MVKTQQGKHQHKPEGAAETTNVVPESPSKVEASSSDANPPAWIAAKKDAARSKKQLSAKTGSLLPSAFKLEQLKAAVTAAGGSEKLLLILQHVEDAGGRTEVVESIEAYRVLKTVLDEPT